MGTEYYVVLYEYSDENVNICKRMIIGKESNAVFTLYLHSDSFCSKELWRKFINRGKYLRIETEYDETVSRKSMLKILGNSHNNFMYS